MMKRITALILSLLFFTACYCIYLEETETVTFTIEEEFTILYVETINGNIDINTSAGDDTGIDVTVDKFAYACTEEDAREYLDKITIKTELASNTYKVIIEFPYNNIPFGFNTYGIAHLTFDNFKDKQIILKTTNGNIDCEEIIGGTIETTNGNVSVKKAEDTIAIEATNGSIEVEEFSGDEFDLETVNGGISLEVSGNGAVDGTLKTTSGKISLALSQDLSCSVELKTNNGAIDLDGVEDYVKERDFISEEVQFTLNEGEGQINGSTVNGSIDVVVH
ncbi:MAG: DUF4097 family beta strand repeat protein [Deltaproteobacteria bacterium]|nr:DUF4097 family beta strand repeat protein [Deltaproteobacteria bacterium]